VQVYIKILISQELLHQSQLYNRNKLILQSKSHSTELVCCKRNVNKTIIYSKKKELSPYTHIGIRNEHVDHFMVYSVHCK
jgi:hypothetical protein